MELSRRHLLKALGWSAAGVTVMATGACTIVLPHRGAPLSKEARAWLSLRPDGRIQVLSPRSEIGQGIAVSLRQIVAEETDFPLDNIHFVSPRTDRIPPAKATVGSESMMDYGPLMAKTAAVLGREIRRAGAQRLGVAENQVEVAGREIRAADGGSLPLGDLAAAGSVMIDANAIDDIEPRSFRAGRKHRVVGTAQPTDAIRAIVTGEAALYADDIRRPGMLFGAVLRPAMPGAEAESVDEIPARDIPGYVGLHRDGDFVGITAETRGALERAREAVRVKWRAAEPVTQAAILAATDVDAALAEGDLEHTVVEGKVATGKPFDLDLRLDVPMAAHAAMEPRCAVAEFESKQPERLRIWTGTQDVHLTRVFVADRLGLDPEAVTIEGMRVGGGFGGKAFGTVELEAARLARAFGRPVKVQWTRAEEFSSGFHRPPSSHRIRARLDTNGGIADWWHALCSGHVIFMSSALSPLLQFATSFVADFGVSRGSIPPYAAAATRVEFTDSRIPVYTGPWRGLGAAPNVWAVETAIDALARKAGQDPLAFRRAAIDPKHERLRRALDRAAALAGWDMLRSSPTLAYGLAAGIYKDMAYAAVVAEVELAADRSARVKRLWCAHDCGQVVNPDQVRAQIEGNLTWGLGMALKEGLYVEDGRIAAESYADYDVGLFSDSPEIDIELIEEGEPPTGAGESAIVAATAAITNAIAAASGQTVVRLPYLADFHA